MYRPANCRASSISILAKRRRPSASWPICAATTGSPARIADTATPWPRASRPRSCWPSWPARPPVVAADAAAACTCTRPRVGLFGTNGIVAAGIPAAVGLAISAKVRGTDQVAVAFFGDGATQPRRVSRGGQLRQHPERARRLRLREQSLRHGHAAGNGHPKHQYRQQGGRLRHSRRPGRRQRRAGRVASGAKKRSTGPAPARDRR